LIENFLYVKGCLDKLQMASLEMPAASPEHEREVGKLKDSFSHVVDERNRIAVKVDALDRDREKQKQQRESGLERVMNANARLLEDRDRLEKEKARVSDLYQKAMGAMGAVAPTQTNGGQYPAAGAGNVDATTIQALQDELKQKSEMLAKREQEGESLRARLRKLAMV